MNHDLNHATRRLLQVILDMLWNPSFDELDPEGKRPYGVSRYRGDQQCVEAAHRAAQQAQQMLVEATTSSDDAAIRFIEKHRAQVDALRRGVLQPAATPAVIPDPPPPER